MKEEGEPVTLLVYDLSQGMAKSLSMAFVGKQIDAIYHTSVLVYGCEVAFGKGVEIFQPSSANQNPTYGSVIERIDMGMSHVPFDLWNEFLEQIKSEWTADKYHLLDNNCNSFSNEVCQFLVGKEIPNHIQSLPDDVMSTPFGQSLKPMIEQIFGSSSRKSADQYAGVEHTVDRSANMGSSFNGNQEIKRAIITNVSSLPVLQNMIVSNRCVAIDFTSQNCGPCVAIAPEFERLVEENDRVVGIKVETSMAREICQFFQISATPTFKFFLDGVEMSEMKGANGSELKSFFDYLVYSAYPPHKHSRLSLKTIQEIASSAPVGYIVSSNIDMIFKKLESIMMDANPSFSYKTELETLQCWLKSDYKTSTIIPHDWHVLPGKIIEFLPSVKLFPLFDILRLLSLNRIVQGYLNQSSNYFSLAF